MQSRGCSLADWGRGRKEHRRYLHGHCATSGGKEKMNCRRNPVFNKLLRSALHLLKSELCKQWKQREGLGLPITFPGLAGNESYFASEYAAGSILDVVSTL